jgi:hypothetical protein
MKALVAAGLVLVLAACVPIRGTNERGMSDAEIEAKDEATCVGLGAVRGSQPYIACRLQLRSDRSAEDRARRWS